MIRDPGGSLLFRISRLRDLMKLSADPDDLVLLFLDELFQIEHVLTSKKSFVGI
jgi:hypothetical protein